MSPFWRAFWGGVLGKIAGAILVAACVVLWLGPEDWVKWFVSDLPAFFTPATARWAFFSLGVVALLLMVYPPIRRLVPETKKNAYVPLKEAATIAYEETRGTRAAINAEGLKRDDILGYYAYALFQDSTLYGKHPPSRILEPVPKEEYGRCGFSDDYSALRRHGKNQNLYEDLQIRRSDLLRRITELKDRDAPLPREERGREISEIYGDAVALRNHVFLLRVVDAASEVRKNDLEHLLIEKMRELAPEQTINLETINMYKELDHPLCNLQDRTRAMVFSEVLLRVKKILEDYK